MWNVRKWFTLWWVVVKVCVGGGRGCVHWCGKTQRSEKVIHGHVGSRIAGRPSEQEKRQVS